MNQPTTVVYLSYGTYPIVIAEQAREALGDVLSASPSRCLDVKDLGDSHGEGYWAVTLPAEWREQLARTGAINLDGARYDLEATLTDQIQELPDATHPQPVLPVTAARLLDEFCQNTRSLMDVDTGPFGELEIRQLVPFADHVRLQLKTGEWFSVTITASTPPDA